MPDLWINTVDRDDPEADGYWLELWTGYEWVYFAGPYGDRAKAAEAQMAWEQEMGPIKPGCMRTVSYD